MYREFSHFVRKVFTLGFFLFILHNSNLIFPVHATSKDDIYNLSVLVPVSFGDPATIIPEPEETSEIGGKLKFDYSQEKIINSGILANFGTNQVGDFKIIFNVYNPGFLSKEVLVPIPPNTSYQQVIIKSIEPKPENVIKDFDGNYQALFRLERNQFTTVTVTGSVNLYASPILERKLLTAKEQEG